MDGHCWVFDSETVTRDQVSLTRVAIRALFLVIAFNYFLV